MAKVPGGKNGENLTEREKEGARLNKEEQKNGAVNVCVFSDSHGYPDHMLRVIEKEQPDLIFHLGDGESDLRAVRRANPDLTIHSVRGNCDLFSAAPTLLKTKVAGVKFFATHGHEYKVKYDRDFQTLRYAGLEADARVVLFGHTHIPYHDRVWGMEIVNPGSIGYGPRAGYAVLMIEDGKVAANLKQIAR